MATRDFEGSSGIGGLILGDRVLCFLGQGGLQGGLFDTAYWCHEDRLKPDQTLVTVVSRSAFPDDEDGHEPRSACRLCILQSAPRGEPAKVVGADVVEHRVNERITECEKLRTGLADGLLTINSGVPVALRQAEGAQYI